VIGSEDQQRSQPWIDRALRGEAVQFERRYTIAGQDRWLSVSYVPLHAADGAVEGFVGVLNDISPQRREEQRLLHLSQVDSLTGTLNRAGLLAVLEQKIRAGEGELMALLYIDLDQFKPVNDAHGHPVGDEVLKAFAARLRRRVRPTDSVARMGGDEFIVLLYGVRALRDAEAVAASIVAQACQPYQIGDRQIVVGASVGVACGVSQAGGANDLITRADAMLIAAKRRGRGTHAAEQMERPPTREGQRVEP
jgi:diguanylate cyclase (GGDEF)-like protein